MRPTWVFILSVTLAGCGAEAEWGGTVTDSAGVAIVTNPPEPIWRAGEAWQVEEELRIGTMEGEPEYQFGSIIGLDVARDGRIYVLDQQAQEVRVFGPDGRFVSKMGKAGSGPGELSMAAGPVFVGAGDTTFVPDMMLQRVSKYTGAGEPVGSYPIPMTDGISYKWLEAPDQRGLIQQAVVMAFPGMPDAEPSSRLLRRNTSGEVVDTLMTLPLGKTMSFAGDQMSFEIFSSEPVWTLARDGSVIMGENAAYRLGVYSLAGELERVIVKDVERRAITEDDQAEFRRLIRAAWERAGMPPQQQEVMSQALGFAAYYPAFANIMAGPFGTIWVQGVQTPESVKREGGTFDFQDFGGAGWEVFDADGRFLGVVRMPPRFSPMVFEDDRIYGVLRDELDVQYVAALRLVGAEDDPGDG